jgi:hypothetical protein
MSLYEFAQKLLKLGKDENMLILQISFSNSTLWSFRSAKSLSLFNLNNRGKRNKTIFLFQWMFCQSIFSSKWGVTLKQKLMWFFFRRNCSTICGEVFSVSFFLFMSRNIENAGGTGGFSKSKIVEIRAIKVTHQQHILI